MTFLCLLDLIDRWDTSTCHHHATEVNLFTTYNWHLQYTGTQAVNCLLNSLVSCHILISGLQLVKMHHCISQARIFFEECTLELNWSHHWSFQILFNITTSMLHIIWFSEQTRDKLQYHRQGVASYLPYPYHNLAFRGKVRFTGLGEGTINLLDSVLRDCP